MAIFPFEKISPRSTITMELAGRLQRTVIMNTEMLSVWSSMFMELSPEEAVETFLRCGLAATELSYEHAAVLLKRGSCLLYTSPSPRDCS